MPGPDCWNEHPCGGAGGLEARGPSPAAGRIASSLHFAQSAFKKRFARLVRIQPGFLSLKRRSIKGRAFRNAGNESVAHRGPQSPSCSGRLKKIAAISQAPETKLKLFASVPALLQAHPLMSRRCQSLLRNPIQNVLNNLNYLNELNSAGGRRSFRIIARRDVRGFFSHNR